MSPAAKLQPRELLLVAWDVFLSEPGWLGWLFIFLP
jgi:hypothetical protein